MLSEDEWDYVQEISKILVVCNLYNLFVIYVIY
jgi:hypothetical protein